MLWANKCLMNFLFFQQTISKRLPFVNRILFDKHLSKLPNVII